MSAVSVASGWVWGAAVATLVAAAAAPAAAESPFSQFTGSWSGAGQVRFTGGSAEALKCRAYYTPKDGGGLGMAIRCASTSSKIELRATLAYSGGQVSGSWEERTYNAAGQVTGSANPGKINLAVSGGGFSATMNVGVTGHSQSVSIKADGTGFTSVSINLSKS